MASRNSVAPLIDEKGNKKKLNRKERKQNLENLKHEVEMDDHKIPLQELLTRYQTDIEKGLTNEQALAKLQEHGRNELTPPPEKSELVKLIQCMTGAFAMLLWAGATLCFVAYGVTVVHSADDAPKDNLWLGVALVFVILVSGFFQYYQEAKSTKIMNAFKNLIPQQATVTRNGAKTTVESVTLVYGDIVHVKAGDRVPADLRIVTKGQFKVDNSSLTGESEPQTRNNEFTHDNPLETKNLAFFSTNCVEGDATGIVVRTGDNTIMGRIAVLATGLQKEDTPIGIEIRRFIHMISVFAITLGIIFFCLTLRTFEIIDSVIFLIGIIVANVPEGLPVTVTVSLTMAAKRMASKNCLVKNLEAVETLGSTSTICSDKTGTLTQNRMTVSHMWFNNKIAESDLSDDQSHNCYDRNDSGWKTLMDVAVLCSRSEFKSGQDHIPPLKRECIGDASEAALVRFSELAIGNILDYRRKRPKVVEIPFNSSNKYQVSVHELEDKSYLLVMKGAPERIFERCSTIFSNNKDEGVNDTWTKAFTKAYEDLGGLGERVLGFCDMKLPKAKFPTGFDFQQDPPNFPVTGLRFCGLISLIDPPRPNVPMAVQRCRCAGIKVVMVTGDHPITAKAIARTVGIISKDSETPDEVAERLKIPVSQVDPKLAVACVINGGILKNMTGDELDGVISVHPELVFARTSPQQKLMIVEGFQRAGCIVAVTGDGVNDSPALKAANIGIAMGIAGSDVSKQAAGMILMDDNFASIITGVEEGRRIFDNLKRTIIYILTSNIPEIIPFLLYCICNIPLGLGTIAILCIDLGTDMVPAISMAYEEAENDIMSRKPRDPNKDKLVTIQTIRFAYALLGFIEATAGMYTYFLLYAENGFFIYDMQMQAKWERKGLNDLVDSYGQEWNYNQRKALEYAGYTMFFETILTMQWVNLICAKTTRGSIVFLGMNSNSFAIVGLFFETILAGILFYVPGLNQGLKLFPLKWKWWFLGFPFLAFLFVFEEGRKFLVRRSPNGYISRNTTY